MFVARNVPVDRAVLGPEISSNCDFSPSHRYTCVTCGKDVEYTQSSIIRPFEFFRHRDGSGDCFAAGLPSDQHRLGTEVAVKTIYNIAQRSQRGDVEIDVERWVGQQPNFVISDIRMTEPTPVAVEVIYRCSRLELRRRLNTLFRNGYLVHLICHTGGRYNPAILENHLQKITAYPVDIGRFDPVTLDVTLGSVLSDSMIDFESPASDQLPKYVL